MPDSIFDIKLDAADLARIENALSRLTWRNLDLIAPLTVLSEEALKTFRESFAQERSPRGVPWAPLTQKTQEEFVSSRGRVNKTTGKRQRRRSARRTARRGSEHVNQAAREPGWLLTGLKAEVERYSLAVGERIGPVGYRAEFGDAREGRPARPFVELTPALKQRAGDLLLAALGKKWR